MLKNCKRLGWEKNEKVREMAREQADQAHDIWTNLFDIGVSGTVGKKLNMVVTQNSI